MKPKLFCIVGPSGSGKTTMARFIQLVMNIPAMVSYTTRPPRENELDGIDHWFVPEHKMPSRKDMLAYTLFNGYHYWLPLSDTEGWGACSYVVDEKGLIDLRLRHSDKFEIISILIKCNPDVLCQRVDKERVERDQERLTLDEDLYDVILTNNGKIEYFLADAFHIYQSIIRYGCKYRNPNTGSIHS